MTPSFAQLKTVRGLDCGPLARHVETYVTLLQEQGYQPRTVREHLHLIAHVNRWLVRTGRGPRDLNEPVLARFLKHHWRRARSDYGAWPALCRLLGILREAGVAPPAPAKPRNPAQRLADDYWTYLSGARGLDRSTIYHYSRHSETFLTERFGCGAVRLSTLQAPEVISFVRRHVRRHGSGHALQVVTALRSFLRFLHYRGHVTTDLSPVVPAVAHWRLAGLPKHLPANDVQKVLDHCDRMTAVGRRNYAILLLLARLGLRAGEVIALHLEDIDWEKSQLTIRSKKGCGWARLPLPADVGKALAVYLRQDRPRCSCRHVFVRMVAPYVRLSDSPVIAVMTRNALLKAGVVSARKGAHLFRHSLATEMLRQGASLEEIGQVLRHKDPDSTAIYAKVDLDALRQLAVAWPGGGR